MEWVTESEETWLQIKKIDNPCMFWAKAAEEHADSKVEFISLEKDLKRYYGDRSFSKPLVRRAYVGKSCIVELDNSTWKRAIIKLSHVVAHGKICICHLVDEVEEVTVDSCKVYEAPPWVWDIPYQYQQYALHGIHPASYVPDYVNERMLLRETSNSFKWTAAARQYFKDICLKYKRMRAKVVKQTESGVFWVKMYLPFGECVNDVMVKLKYALPISIAAFKSRSSETSSLSDEQQSAYKDFFKKQMEELVLEVESYNEEEEDVVSREENINEDKASTKHHEKGDSEYSIKTNGHADDAISLSSRSHYEKRFDQRINHHRLRSNDSKDESLVKELPDFSLQSSELEKEKFRKNGIKLLPETLWEGKDHFAARDKFLAKVGKFQYANDEAVERLSDHGSLQISNNKFIIFTDDDDDDSSTLSGSTLVDEDIKPEQTISHILSGKSKPNGSHGTQISSSNKLENLHETTKTFFDVFPKNKRMSRNDNLLLIRGHAPMKSVDLVSKSPLQSNVTYIMENTLKYFNTTVIQSQLWPEISAKRDVLAIAGPGTGKSIGIVAAVSSLVLKETNNTRMPTSIVICSSWRSVQNMDSMFKQFINAEDVVSMCGSANDEEAHAPSLYAGCKVLIAKPAAILRAVSSKTTGFNSLSQLVFDDFDVLCDQYLDVLREIMREWQKSMMSDDRKKARRSQIICVGSRWTKQIESFSLCFLKQNPILIIADPLEASIYGKVKHDVSICDETRKLVRLHETLQNLKFSGVEFVAVVVQNQKEVDHMARYLRSISYYCVRVPTGDVIADVIKTTERLEKNFIMRDYFVVIGTENGFRGLSVCELQATIYLMSPSNRSMFGSTLSVMMNNFQYTKENQPPKNHFILSEEDASQAYFLKRLFDRVGQKLPPHLTHILKKSQMMKELASKQTMSLCSNIKMFGSCATMTTCKMRHYYNPSIDTPNIDKTFQPFPMHGHVKIRITHVISATLYYGMLVAYRPSPNQKVCTYDNFTEKIQVLIAEHFKSTGKSPDKSVLKPGDLLIDMSAMKRAKVMRLPGQKGDCEWTTSGLVRKVCLRHVDTGEVVVCRREQLAPIPAHIAEISFQAIEICVTGLQAAEGDHEYFPHINTFIHDKLFEKNLEGNIVFALGHTIWIDPAVIRVKLASLGRVVEDFNVKKELIGKKYAQNNPEHINKLKALCSENQSAAEALTLQLLQPKTHPNADRNNNLNKQITMQASCQKQVVPLLKSNVVQNKDSNFIADKNSNCLNEDSKQQNKFNEFAVKIDSKLTVGIQPLKNNKLHEVVVTNEIEKTLSKPETFSAAQSYSSSLTDQSNIQVTINGMNSVRSSCSDLSRCSSIPMTWDCESSIGLSTAESVTSVFYEDLTKAIPELNKMFVATVKKGERYRLLSEMHMRVENSYDITEADMKCVCGLVHCHMTIKEMAKLMSILLSMSQSRLPLIEFVSMSVILSTIERFVEVKRSARSMFCIRVISLVTVQLLRNRKILKVDELSDMHDTLTGFMEGNPKLRDQGCFEHAQNLLKIVNDLFAYLNKNEKKRLLEQRQPAKPVNSNIQTAAKKYDLLDYDRFNNIDTTTTDDDDRSLKLPYTPVVCNYRSDMSSADESTASSDVGLVGI